jgi:fumarate hydratase class I
VLGLQAPNNNYKMKSLTLPLDEKAIRSLKVGEPVELTGLVITGRDKFHKYFADGGKVSDKFAIAALYHCGPVVVKDKADYKVLAAGPTTSVRENPYEAKFIEKTSVRVIIGKGGMNDDVLNAMKKFGCIYLQAVGGAAAVAAKSVKKVVGVDFLEEFGAAEACWHFEVEKFRAVVAMDANGNSLFSEIDKASRARLKEIL